jgi:predicted transcriptional regulator
VVQQVLQPPSLIQGFNCQAVGFDPYAKNLSGIELTTFEDVLEAQRCCQYSYAFNTRNQRNDKYTDSQFDEA